MKIYYVALTTNKDIVAKLRKFIKYKEKYMVSDDGEVWEIQKNNLKKKPLSKNNHGYLYTSINGKPLGVHRIVLEAFTGYSSEEVDHKANNCLSNLEYVSHKENVRRYNSKKVKWGDKEYNSLTEVALIVGEKTTGGISHRIKKGYKLRGMKIEYI